jgi:small subunit ribosomal protein S7
MSRRRKATKRKILPDAKYNSLLLAKFINVLMRQGKRALAEQIVYKALEQMESKLNKNPIESFEQFVAAVTPELEVKSRRVGGATYQVPVEVPKTRGSILAIRWIVKSARNRSERTITDRLLGEFLDISNNKGASLKVRENTHKMAESNRAFAHYNW